MQATVSSNQTKPNQSFIHSFRLLSGFTAEAQFKMEKVFSHLIANLLLLVAHLFGVTYRPFGSTHISEWLNAFLMPKKKRKIYQIPSNQQITNGLSMYSSINYKLQDKNSIPSSKSDKNAAVKFNSKFLTF